MDQPSCGMELVSRMVVVVEPVVAGSEMHNDIFSSPVVAGVRRCCVENNGCCGAASAVAGLFPPLSRSN